MQVGARGQKWERKKTGGFSALSVNAVLIAA